MNIAPTFYYSYSIASIRVSATFDNKAITVFDRSSTLVSPLISFTDCCFDQYTMAHGTIWTLAIIFRRTCILHEAFQNFNDNNETITVKFEINLKMYIKVARYLFGKKLIYKINSHSENIINMKHNRTLNIEVYTIKYLSHTFLSSTRKVHLH